MDLPYEFARENNLVLLEQNSKKATILAKNPIDDEVVSDIKNMLNKNLDFVFQKSYEFERVFEQTYNIANTDTDEKNNLEKYLLRPPEELLHYLIKRAIDLNSTDIHIIKSKNHFIIKFRINSILRTFTLLDILKCQSLMRIIKLKSNIDISKALTPLEGRFDFIENDTKIDCRVSVMPTIDLEKITIRLLGNVKKLYTFDDIALEQQEMIKDVLNKKSGFILVTGPTGSGKSTTIFTMLNYLNDGKKNIISIEDPIEYKIDAITQIPVNCRNDMDFHNILKFVLRQDPDIINIGEIRDLETASLAFDSANTGHMVLSTMHTRDTISSVERLKDLHIHNYRIASSVSLIISQRLVRVLCEDCKKEVQMQEKILEKFNLDKHKKYFKPCGCKKCLNTGYSGLKSVFEILKVDNRIKNLISDDNLNTKNSNIVTLKDKLLKLFEQGETSIEEISKYI